ncbi:hypothetical protein [Streptomyces sp. DH24]|uniref:hypothetical protein n=1 Tax=Streptomyces sp. DH24 TaxID=3040123 RepID=UPI0024425ADC|nr:hypothetical protein [Streptomyces sp. DH24]MDG9720445.1 hypothetical protein [Streptomyces sp. DH24]
MTTGPNTSPSNPIATAVSGPPPPVEPLTFATPPHHGPVAPPDHPPAGGEGRDPVGDLVHTAVSDRPLDEVVRLVTLLEESPEYAQTVVEVLRAAAVDRPVEDVARLVAELTRPPRDADSADATIRAAIENRDVEDVTRLMSLLHRAPLQPHCGEEAVRAAATGRPVEELVELIGRLTEEQSRHTGGATRQPDPSTAPVRETITSSGLSPGSTPVMPTGKPARVRAREQSPRIPGDQPDRPLFWPSWLAAAALLVCAAACFPLHRDGAPFLSYAVPLTASAACVVLALLVAFRPSIPLLAAGAVVPAGLAGLVLLEDRVRSTTLTRAVELMLAPPWSAGLTAVCASLASLAALLLLLMVQVADRQPAPRSAAGQAVAPD